MTNNRIKMSVPIRVRPIRVPHLSGNTIQAIRDATNKAWALGDESFIEQVSNNLSGRAKPSQQGGDRKSKVFNAS